MLESGKKIGRKDCKMKRKREMKKIINIKFNFKSRYKSKRGCQEQDPLLYQRRSMNQGVIFMTLIMESNHLNLSKMAMMMKKMKMKMRMRIMIRLMTTMMMKMSMTTKNSTKMITIKEEIILENNKNRIELTIRGTRAAADKTEIFSKTNKNN